MNRALRGVLADAPSASDTKASVSDAKTETTPEPDARVYSRDELGRFVQAEVDRREAKRNKEAQAQAKRDLERQMMDQDPLGFADLKRQEMEQESVEQKTYQERLAVAEATMTTYDRAVLDPLFLALPEADRTRLLKAHGHLTGLEARTALAKDALKTYGEQMKAEGAKEAEAKLRKNPAFTKQLMNQLRGTREEPEVLSGATNGAVTDINSWLRG